MAHDVFISHSSVDKKAADAICHTLEQNGVKCWIAPRDIRAGEAYGGEIIRGIQECKVFLLVFSREANASPAVAKEVERAVLGYRKTVIPYRIEDVAMSANLEFFLTDVHWLDAYPDDTVFENLVTAVKNALGLNAAPSSGTAPQGPNAPQHATGPAQPAPGAMQQPAPQRKRKWLLLAIAVAAAAVLAVVFLVVPGLPNKDAPDAVPPPPAEENGPSAPPEPTGGIQALTGEQQAMLDTLAQKFPEALPGLASQILDDKAFLAAAAKASYTDPVFDIPGLGITMLLPDPRAESLGKLGIEPYTPGSDARAYIRENYAKLCGMDTPDRIEIPVTLYYEDEIGGRQTLDWTLSSVFWGLNDYSNLFTPHVEQFMDDVGFYAAAAELLMPAAWDAAGGPDGAAYPDGYFSDLADALSFKGVDIGGQLAVDRDDIEKALRERLARTWAYGSVSIATHSNSVPYLPCVRFRSVSGIDFFSQVREGLDAQYRSGSKPKPPSAEGLEHDFLSEAREMADGILDSQTAKDQSLVMEHDYTFGWEALGENGISACPDLVEEIRTYMDSYDFDLMFM